jgi:multicomponent Na+:H+ antiporter subunit C
VTAGLVFGTAAALVIGVGVYGLIAHRSPVRRILAFNVIGSGIFLIFGARGHGLGPFGADPVPHAMVITGIIVALAATALALTLAVRIDEVTRGAARPDEQSPDDGTAG